MRVVQILRCSHSPHVAVLGAVPTRLHGLVTFSPHVFVIILVLAVDEFFILDEFLMVIVVLI